MQYFTPDLFVRFQNFQGERALNAVHAEWDRAIDLYRARLRELEGILPRSVRRLVKEFALHDAAILAMERGPRATLTITLRLDPPQPFLLVLTYSLLGDPEINRSALPAEFRSLTPLWLYDELDSGGTIPPSSGRTIYTHDILLSNGWEVKIQFWKLAVSQPEALLPAPESTPSSPQAPVSQSA